MSSERDQGLPVQRPDLYHRRPVLDCSSQRRTDGLEATLKRLLARLYPLLDGLRDRFWIAVTRWEYRHGKTIPLDEVIDEAIEEFLDGLSGWYALLQHQRGKTAAWEEVKTRLGITDEPATT